MFHTGKSKKKGKGWGRGKDSTQGRTSTILCLNVCYEVTNEPHVQTIEETERENKKYITKESFNKIIAKKRSCPNVEAKT